jgi:adenine-specific DNA-methyltransferase
MPAAVDSRQKISEALSAFSNAPLRKAATEFLKRLGYASSRTLPTDSVEDFCRQFDAAGLLEHPSALKSDWKSIDLLFQLTDEDISVQDDLFDAGEVQPSLLKSYLFFAVELTGDHYARGKLTALARQLNRLFPMPVMVLIKHLADKEEVLSIAVINRRQNQRDASKDVLGKVTIIRDISLSEPHRGHLDILASFSRENLVHPNKEPINSFDSLHAAWEQIFNVDLLNERFYKELSNWYFWALPQVEFPDDLEKDVEKRRATGLIRLLTRLIFCWFLKEKGLIPEKLFHPADLAKVLKGFDPESETSSTFYLAILQNLFFATLNQRMGKDSKGCPYRAFATDEGFQKNRETYDVNNLYRYEKLFAVPQEEALALFADIPFLNGGLFECLDRTEEGTNRKLYLDGFSRNAKKRPHIPDRLFFDSGETADLSEAYGDKKRKAEKVTGLISILNRYKFTIVENTPIDQEIALDPELLGKVFENLLASYNEETKTTARKQTGSFYTPRPIVEYMVDESLKAHLSRILVEKAGMNDEDANAGLDLLFTYTEKEHPFSDKEVATLITAIDEVKILDPACGSGAFPMGVLHKLVYILGKLDPDNERWKRTQLAKLDSALMREAVEAAFADNADDYGRKLSLIENCLYGVDIQPIAIQISKLRFFISLVCDQRTNRNKKDNHGIRPLPNLETKFVAANTLIGLPIPEPDLFIRNLIEPIEKEIEQGYHSHFSVQRRDQKIALQKRIKTLRQKLSDTLLDGLGANKHSDVAKKAQLLADWDAFDPQASAEFFDPHWMFGRSLANGFDVVIGNPPYRGGREWKKEEGNDYEYFTRNYVVADYQFDIYALFWEQAIRLSSAGGVVSYITPNTWLNNQSTSKLRNYILSETRLLTILDCSRQDVFASVVVLPIVTVLQKIRIRTGEVKIFEPTDGNFELVNQVDQSVWAEDELKIFNISLKAVDVALRAKIEARSGKLEEEATVKFGIKLYETGKGNPPQKASDAKNHIFESDKKCGADYRPYLEGKDVDRYCTKYASRWLKYGPNLAAPRDPALFSGDRLLFRRIVGERLIGTYVDENYVTSQLLQIVKPNNKARAKPLLAILNSTLIAYYFKKKYNRQDKTFPEIRIYELSSLPIPKLIAERDATGLAKKVDQILIAKQTNPAADTSALEREIDQQVYALYGLTPEEIAIVEGAAQ